MIIVLDTNALYNDYLLQSSHLKMLLKYAENKNATVCIPQVVLAETEKHFKSNYDKSLRTYNAFRKLLEITDGVFIEQAPSDVALGIYKEKIGERLNQLSIRVLNIPDEGIGSYLFDAVDGKPPFKSEGKGLQDVVIWRSVLAELRKNQTDRLIFISEDSGFYSNKQGNEIPKVLLEQLQEIGINEEVVIFRRSLQEFNAEFIIPNLESRYKRGDEIKGSIVENIDAAGLLESYDDVIGEQFHTMLEKTLGFGYSDIDTIRFLRWLEKLEVVEAVKMDEDNIITVVRAGMAFDAEVASPHQNVLIEVMAMTKDNLLMLRGTSWDSVNNMYYVSIRGYAYLNIEFTYIVNQRNVSNVRVTDIAVRKEDF